MDPSGPAGAPHPGFSPQRPQHAQHLHHPHSHPQQHQTTHSHREEPDPSARLHHHHGPSQGQHPQQSQPHLQQHQHAHPHAHHPSLQQQSSQPQPQSSQHLVAQPTAMSAPMSQNITSTVSSASPTSSLWTYFERGDKMLKTNKFEANCIFCKRFGTLTRVRGEKRMMSGHLRNCPNATPAAKSEGEAVATELKNRRTIIRNRPTPGMSTTPFKKGGRRKSPAFHTSAIQAVAAATVSPGQVNLPGGSGSANPYFEAEPAPGFMTNDGIRIYYEEKGIGHPLILIHGWSGTCKYFVRNFDTLAASFRVIQFDLRGHGESEKPAWGFHVHRLATDLLNLMDHLELSRVALLGCSLGCAVIWAFVELFGVQRISAAMFVDQSPWQMYAPDGSWRFGANGVFSEASLAHLTALLHHDARRCHTNTVKTCLTRAPTGRETEFFVGESLKSDAWFLAKLMSDHTNIDWRSVLSLVTCPALVIVGKRSRVFPWQGVAYAAEHMPNARLISFDEGSHWLYYEEAERFNSVVTAFLQKLHSQTS